MKGVQNMNNNFCPFVNGTCKANCVFKTHSTSTTRGTSTCLIAIKLDDINGYQSDQMTEIFHEIKKGK